SLNGLGFVLNRYLQSKDSEIATMFYTNLIPFLANLPAVMITNVPTPEVLVWLPAVILLGPIGMYAGILAVKHADTSMLGPFTLLRLMIGVAAGAVICDELPDMLSGIGAAMILGGCLLSAMPLAPTHFPLHRSVLTNKCL